MDRRTVLGLGAATLVSLAAKADPVKPDGSLASDPREIIPLWQGTPPGGDGVHLTAHIVERSTDTAAFNDRYVDSVGEPLLTVFRPDKPDGSAVLLCPGGGYARTVIDKEAFETARRLNGAGVTAFVLRYRLPGEGWANRSDVPLQDAQRAIRHIRMGTSAFGVDPARVGVLGFSAGGHVAASLATRFADKVYAKRDMIDDVDARPDFVGLMYPVITMGPAAHSGSRDKLLGDHPTAEAIAKYSCERHVSAAVPPAFICYALDDEAVPPLGNGFAMYEALAAAKVKTELHAFQEGHHGFGIRLAAGLPCAAWPRLFLKWAKQGGWLRGEIV